MSGLKSDVFEIINDYSKHFDWKGSLTFEGNVYLSNEIVSSQSKVGEVSFSWTVMKGPLDVFKVLTTESNHLKIMRFCQEEYSTSGGFSGEGYSKLSKNIQQYSRKQDGCSYVKNGTTAYKGTKQGRWRCCFNQVYSDQS
jgi:hypothetical protein